MSGTIEAARLFAAGQAASGLISVPVAALTEGVLRTMFLTKLKTATAVLAVTTLSLTVLGGGLTIAQQVKGERGNQVVVDTAKPPESRNKQERRQGDNPLPRVGFVDGGTVGQPSLLFPGIGLDNLIATETPDVRLGRGSKDYNAIFETVLDIVDDFFEVAYANRYDGRIETHHLEKPTASPPVRRRAVVWISVDDAGGYRVGIRVHREEKVTTSRFDTKLSRPFRETHWEDIGRDIKLEQVMRQRLVEWDRKERAEKPQIHKQSENPREQDEANHPNGVLLRNVHVDAVNPDHTISVITLSNRPVTIMNLPVAPDAKIRVKKGNTLAAVKIGMRLVLRLRVMEDQIVVTEIRQEGSTAKK